MRLHHNRSPHHPERAFVLSVLRVDDGSASPHLCLAREHAVQRSCHCAETNLFSRSTIE